MWKVVLIFAIAVSTADADARELKKATKKDDSCYKMPACVQLMKQWRETKRK